MNFDNLIEKYLEGSMSPAEKSAFLSALQKDRELLKNFVIDVHLDNSISSFFENENSSGSKSSCVIELSDEDLKDIAAAGNTAEPPPDDDDKNI